MKIVSLALFVNHCLQYVIHTSKIFNIDESHALKHSLEVFDFTKRIYNSEVIKYPYLEKQKEVIFASAILHDMCDKKYMDQTCGIEMIKDHMKNYMKYDQLHMVDKIISTMSYSTVKKHGYPDLGEYQLAYHIVREADLLAAYDIDRCIIYSIMQEKLNYEDTVKRVIHIFENRVLQYRNDKLFVTNYSKNLSFYLHQKASKLIEELSKTIDD